MLLKSNTIFHLITELNPQLCWGFSSVIKCLDILQKLKDLKKSTLLRLILLNIEQTYRWKQLVTNLSSLLR